ncbi:MAG: hypothetical protein U0821_05105 [Chloroflexota bacterium]
MTALAIAGVNAGIALLVVQIVGRPLPLGLAPLAPAGLLVIGLVLAAVAVALWRGIARSARSAR